MFTMLTPCCISLLQVSQFRLSDLLLGSGRKAVTCNQEINILYHIQHVQNHKGALLLRNMFLGKTPFYLCGVLLVLTNSIKKSPSPPKPQVICRKGCLTSSPAAHCVFASFRLLGGSLPVREIPKISSFTFTKAKLLIISQGCIYPPRPRTWVEEGKEEAFLNYYNSFTRLTEQETPTPVIPLQVFSSS